MLRVLLNGVLFFCLSITVYGHTDAKKPDPIYKIGLLIVATGKYIQYVVPLIESGRKYFCKDHNVTYFVFTDGKAPEASDIVTIYQARLGWPYDTLMRFAMYDQLGDQLQNMDYIFACDADMRFVAYIGNEILGDLVGTLHPGFVGYRGTYETNSKSSAYVQDSEGTSYFAGGFHGGKKTEFLNMVHHITTQIQKDLLNNYIAIWHDESHLNRYFIDHSPTIILSPAYCYPPSWGLPYQPKLLALDKNHKEMHS